MNLHQTKRRGRPRSADPLHRISVRLNSREVEWLSLWSDDSPTTQIRDLLERAMKFWPAGPYKFR